MCVCVYVYVCMCVYEDNENFSNKEIKLTIWDIFRINLGK